MTAKSYPPGTVLMRPMLDGLARNWWLIVLRGVCAIIFGLLTIAWPGLTLLTLVIFYGVFALFDGGLAIGAAIMGDTPAPRWWLALVGILGIGAGAVTLAWPGITGLLLLFFIAGWAIAAGVFDIVGAIRLRKEIDDEWLLIASGVLSVLFGVLILLFPGAGALGIAFAIGMFALVYGFLLVGFGLRLRKHAAIKI
ncbi:MAG: HdeD family acid-resistance protein [Hyphomicrobium sp.]|uniref:HdeD family acid-resistance protein n=1 Tax=Hyphomicrobium sp. TaxID=82 RepID=UPI0039E56DAF